MDTDAGCPRHGRSQSVHSSEEASNDRGAKGHRKLVIAMMVEGHKRSSIVPQRAVCAGAGKAAGNRVALRGAAAVRAQRKLYCLDGAVKRRQRLKLGAKTHGPMTRQELSQCAQRWARRQRQQGRAQIQKWPRPHFQQVASAWDLFLGQLKAPPSPSIRCLKRRIQSITHSRCSPGPCPACSARRPLGCRRGRDQQSPAHLWACRCNRVGAGLGSWPVHYESSLPQKRPPAHSDVTGSSPES